MRLSHFLLTLLMSTAAAMFAWVPANADTGPAFFYACERVTQNDGTSVSGNDCIGSLGAPVDGDISVEFDIFSDELPHDVFIRCIPDIDLEGVAGNAAEHPSSVVGHECAASESIPG